MSGPLDPLKESAEKAASLRRLSVVDADNPLPRRRAIRVLCVEDDPVDQRLMQFYLERMAVHEAEVVFARSLDEARGYYQSERFDVCLCDFWLGHETTMPLVDEIRFGAKGCPVVLMSTLDNDDIELIGRRSGTCGFIGKADLSAASLDRILATILPAVPEAPREVEPFDDAVTHWLRDLLRRLDRLHAGSSLALGAAADSGTSLAEQLLSDIEFDTADMRGDIVAKLLSYEKIMSARARHGTFDVVPQLQAAVDVVRAQAGEGGRIDFRVPCMSISIEGAPELFADLLQGFMAEALDMMRTGTVVVEPAIRGGMFDLTLRTEQDPSGALPEQEAPADARQAALVSVRRLIVEALATSCCGHVEVATDGTASHALLSVPRRLTI
ncbi:Response regulator of citrate/malate metabolism [Hartmannibacter diazotrophicus]|uniref:Response regulator of citrate/malate metabolism n=1 Tax=Hartmannibacter diazotrophicus TaxID=1482074 RepID=A0A2C9D1H2_9HYPH|nr:response regulator [Hartmannibacter diazotrophicus]SON54096.1 Response regulator of citrate/malate metabolism [Hartmannibacter diazotrophicus]